MSGCHPDNKCQHGHLVGACHFCIIFESKEQITSLTNRINALHEFKLRQADENKLRERFERLTINENCILREKIDDVITLMVNGDCKNENYELELRQRIEKLEKNVGIFLDGGLSLQEQFNEAAERIIKLEKVWQQCSDAKPLDEIESCFTKVSMRLNLLEAKIESIGNISDAVKRAVTHLQDSDGRKPWKCPVCMASGEFEIENSEDIIALGVHRTDATGRKFTKCHACDGRSIVWG